MFIGLWKVTQNTINTNLPTTPPILDSDPLNQHWFGMDK